MSPRCVICLDERRPAQLFRSQRNVRPRVGPPLWYPAGSTVCLRCEREGRTSYDSDPLSAEDL